MNNPENGQKKTKLIIVLFIIAALALLVVSCIGITLSSTPDVSEDNPFGSELEENEPNLFESFWINLKGFFTGDETPDDEQVRGNDEIEIGNGEFPDSSESVKRKEGFYNFLLVGKDVAGSNTDVIMALSFDTKNNKIAILQMPRDTYVNVPYSFKKLNSVYSAAYNNAAWAGKSLSERKQAGVEGLCDALLTNFGIVIDRYIFVDISGFRHIVDAIDGVDVYVQEDMTYYDEYQDLEINLTKGNHHLTGNEAEGFVRFRSGYVNADIGRMDAQKIFMSAFLDKLFSVSTIGKIPELADTVLDYLETDVSISDAVVFGKELLEMDLSQITMHSLQGEALYHTDGISYFSVYEKANLDLVNKYFNAFDKELKQENVEPIMLKGEPENSEYTGGSTAQDINEDNPPLIYWN